MARNGSGVHSRINTFSSGASITAAGHNQNWADLETEMTNSVAADGQTVMVAPLKHSSGSAALPSITFSSDVDTGFYNSAPDTISIALGGAQIGTFGLSGFSTKGTTTNNTADAGYVGEYISGTRASGSALGLTSVVAADITSISLTAGDWDVWGTIGNVATSGSLLTDIIGWISVVSATIVSSPNGGAYAEHAYSFAANAALVMPVGQLRLSLAATTTVYLGMRATFTVAGQAGYGFIGARRVR